MKNIIIAFLLFIPILAKTQITLEHTYNLPLTSLEIYNLGKNEFKYVSVNYSTGAISMYNMNHSLYLTGNLPRINNNMYFGHFSRTMFDCDTSNIEYLIRYTYGSSPNPDSLIIFIARTNGTTIFRIDSFVPVSSISSLGVSTSIRNTSGGTKMILQNQYNLPERRVYALCDSLPSFPINVSVPQSNNMNLSNPYPNPAKEYTKLSYSLPDGVNSGEILIYDINGNVIKTYKVDNTFNELILSTSDLASGSYYYQLKTSQGLTGGKKFIKID